MQLLCFFCLFVYLETKPANHNCSSKCTSWSKLGNVPGGWQQNRGIPGRNIENPLKKKHKVYQQASSVLLKPSFFKYLDNYLTMVRYIYKMMDACIRLDGNTHHSSLTKKK
jgi:hypothetical protein